jgi:hypothetical protein
MSVRGRPFQAGNKFGRGRPRGSRNKASLAAQALLEGHSEAIVKKCMYMALSGDSVAMRLCIERLLPTCKELPVRVAPLRARTAGELAQTVEGLLKGVFAGQLAPASAQTIANLLEIRRRTLETVEYEARLMALEAKHAAG